MKRVVRILMVCAWLLTPVGTHAQVIDEPITRDGVQLEIEIISEEDIKLHRVTNVNSQDFKVVIDGDEIEKYEVTDSEGRNIWVTRLPQGKHYFHYRNSRKSCSRVAINVNGIPKTIWTKHDTKAEYKKLHPETEQQNTKVVQEEAKTKEEPKSKHVEPRLTRRDKKLISGDVVMGKFSVYCNNNEYYSDEAVEGFVAEVKGHLQTLGYMSNANDKRIYIVDKGLEQNLQNWEVEYREHDESRDNFINRFLNRYEQDDLESYDECHERIDALVDEKLEQRYEALKDLQSVVKEVMNVEQSTKDINWSQIGMLGGTLLIIVLLIVWFVKTKDKKTRQKSVSRPTNRNVKNASSPESTIVVRRKTTTILKTQSLDDVKDNEAYIRIDSQEYSQNSAVRYMYIKNSCVKDIYAMYAADLRNPNNPNEDGCMVLGRWVYDEAQKVYDVSLEYVVLPGDDAVFKEYELNFGGKIKLRVAEKLRKLRTETNLQYDLTCWMHSHPGLGVFFSNSDSNVQMQLKHPTHPKFLTAIVVDILTPQQEMGIFTFKHDGTVNARTDLMKMYSLEELYQWAVDSERRIEAAGENYRLLSKAQKRCQECYEVSMSNSAIIDLTMLVSRVQAGTIGWIQGFKTNSQDNTTVVVSIVSTSRPEMGLNNDLIGCLVVDTHCSIPSIRKMLPKDLASIDFVLVYSTSDNKITTIPLRNKKIPVDKNYYGEANLEDLKIWTRRRR